MLNPISNNWTIFTNVSYYYKSNQSTTDLIILKELFRDYPNNVYWKVEMTTLLITYENEHLTSDCSILLYVNFSPVNGSCDANPKYGTIDTLFIINCDFWYDDDGTIASYSYYCNLL